MIYPRLVSSIRASLAYTWVWAEHWLLYLLCLWFASDNQGAREWQEWHLHWLWCRESGLGKKPWPIAWNYLDEGKLQVRWRLGCHLITKEVNIEKRLRSRMPIRAAFLRKALWATLPRWALYPLPEIASEGAVLWLGHLFRGQGHVYQIAFVGRKLVSATRQRALCWSLEDVDEEPEESVIAQPCQPVQETPNAFKVIKVGCGMEYRFYPNGEIRLCLVTSIPQDEKDKGVVKAQMGIAPGHLLCLRGKHVLVVGKRLDLKGSSAAEWWRLPDPGSDEAVRLVDTWSIEGDVVGVAIDESKGAKKENAVNVVILNNIGQLVFRSCANGSFQPSLYEHQVKPGAVSASFHFISRRRLVAIYDGSCLEIFAFGNFLEPLGGWPITPCGWTFKPMTWSKYGLDFVFLMNSPAGFPLRTSVIGAVGVPDGGKVTKVVPAVWKDR